MGLLTGFSLLLTSQTSSLWQLFITYSLLLSAGSGAIFVVTHSLVPRWFHKKRGLALGITGAGAGLGTVIMAPFAAFLISSFDWRMAYLLIGLVNLIIVIPLSRFLKRDPYEIGALPDGARADLEAEPLQRPEDKEDNLRVAGFSVSQAIKTRSFWLLIFSWLLFASSLFLIMTHLVPHATDIGISSEAAAATLSLLGGASIFGRVLIGAISDRFGIKLTLSICVIVQAGAILWLSRSHDLWELYLFALVYGFAYGGLAPCVAALAVDSFGLGSIGSILGALELGFGAGAAIGPAIGGLIFDIMGNYFIAFIFAAVTSVMVVLLVRLNRRETEEAYLNRQSANI
jgi:MFS family permease